MAVFEFEVVDVQGYCPIYDKGDKFVIDGARLILAKDGALCNFALSSLKRQVPFLAANCENEGKLRCMDKCAEVITGGFVVFACKKLEDATV